MQPIRIYQDGDKVIAGYRKHKMIVVNATETPKGWQYELAFQKKDGTPDRKSNHLLFYADNLKHQLEPLKIR